MLTRRAMLKNGAVITGGAVLAHGPAAQAQGIELAKILIGAPPGGSGDLMARRLAEKLRQAGYANTVIVENRPGAGGQLAVAAMRDSPGDGSVLLLVPSSHLSIYPFTYSKLPYKPEADLLPVSLACYANHAFGVGPAVTASVKTLNDFLAWSRSHRDDATYGSPASGSMSHLIVAVLAHQTGSPLRHIPYRGSTPALQDLRGGQIASLTAPVGAFLPHLKTGQIRLLAVSGNKRSGFVPDVPTYRELGFPITAREWYGFFLPGKAQATVVSRAAAYVQRALNQPELAQGMSEFGLEMATSTPQELSALLQSDSSEWREQIRKIGFTAES